ncbi:DUF4870 family protein [Paludibacterium yongneupense]|uniref:DUF4870 family protein n=1 Tax=Paludibacterium yongneupense TaxID=400061 RepID=UPI00041BE41E|nr:membrane protein [Paludibacterium yongneupense]
MNYLPIHYQDSRYYKLTQVVYILQAISLFVGVTAIAAVIINYVKRSDVRGTVFASHFDWQIRTFWTTVLVGLVGYATVFVLVGFLILFGLWVWYVYRVIKGFLFFVDGKPMPS